MFPMKRKSQEAYEEILNLLKNKYEALHKEELIIRSSLIK